MLVASQALAKPGNNANSTPVSSSSTKQCNNFYFNTAQNSEITSILQEIKKQLTRVENDVIILKGNKTLAKGK